MTQKCPVTVTLFINTRGACLTFYPYILNWSNLLDCLQMTHFFTSILDFSLKAKFWLGAFKRQGIYLKLLSAFAWRCQSQIRFTIVSKASSKNTWQMWSRFILWCCNSITAGSPVFQRQVRRLTGVSITWRVTARLDSHLVSPWWMMDPMEKTIIESVWGNICLFQIYVAQTSSVWWNRNHPH